MRAVTFVEEVEGEAIFCTSMDPFLMQDGTSVSISFGLSLEQIVARAQKDFLTEVTAALAEKLEWLLGEESE